MGATYWIGQDGNIYYGSGVEGAGVQNLGSASNGQFETRSDGLYDRFTDNGVPTLTYGATQIDDPALGGSVLGSNTAPSRSGGGTSRPILNQAAIDNTQRTINEIPGLLQAALEAEALRAANANNNFDAQEKQQRQTYDTSTVTNQKNYDANFMDSIRAGIRGLGGLFQILRGTGASGGTAEQIARDTVGGVTAQDIRAGADTQKENQGELDTSLSTFLTDLRGKREKNEDTRVNNERAIRRDSDTQLQDLYGKMAGFYSEAERPADATAWMNKAGNLTPQIAQNSRTQVSSYDTNPIAVRAPQITAFKGPTEPSVVTSPNGNQVGSGIFTISDPNRREREREQTPLLAGA